MKVRELENLIGECVNNTLTNRSKKVQNHSVKRGKKTANKISKSIKSFKEGLEFSDDFLGADIELEPKVEKAVMLAVHCAQNLIGTVSKPSNMSGSVLEKCFDDIMKLFLDREGDFSVPDLNVDQLQHEFATQLDHQMTNPHSKVARVSKAILDKIVDKLNVYIGEAMVMEVGANKPSSIRKKKGR